MGSTARSRVNLLVLIIFGLLLFFTFITTSRDGMIVKGRQHFSHTDKVEATVSLEPKPDACKTHSVERNTDPNHTRAHIGFWQHLSNETVAAYRKDWQSFVEKEASRPISEIPMKGRGIVLVAGNRDTFVRALTTVRLLRSLSCSLPAEVWHLNDEQPSKDMVRDLYKAGAVTRDLGDPQLIRPVIQRRNAEKQFQIKAAAIINSGFQEIIYLDSDNIPTQDPSFLFRTANYEATGALFWPDFWKTHGENKIFDILNIPCQDEWEQESGQMVIDKRRAWLPLQLAWFMQQHHEIYFQFLNGDKDTFKYAWKALGAPYHMVTPFLGMGGSMVNGRFCGHSMLQYYVDSNNDDQLLFVHANLLKITDKNNFMQDIQGKPVEQPWQLIKRYTMSRANTWLMPQFYISDNGQACMDFIHPEGEPECVLEQFDQVVPGLQEAYFAFGGIGGETRS